jgi:hypothetical protein
MGLEEVMAEEMVILARAFDLLAWLLPKAESWPRAYRRTVVQRLMDAALDFQEALFDAQSQGGTTRQKHLREADGRLLGVFGRTRKYRDRVHPGSPRFLGLSPERQARSQHSSGSLIFRAEQRKKIARSALRALSPLRGDQCSVPQMGDEHASRKPMLKLRLSGALK